ncbi:unnamed protein product [Ceutorhynchus assimilis]|uniref:AB hydrolase-1 domain-containing protein n=1 Tax=Ceutorhynchus assimilis TaxID=467358 RepID=A0A9N9MJ50_9CUCU|nr:unnamed protein product [Ceutorhynchus assimilis]
MFNIFSSISEKSTLEKMSEIENHHKRSWWTKHSENRLAELEITILSVVKSKFKTWFVPIGSSVGQDDKIWTITLNEESKNTPLVMLHGFAAAIGFWCKNFDEIAKDRPVYAIDLLGFGRSSRPTFAKDCESAEQQWVDALEEWRKQVKLEKFILLGHSFGGYLATSYTMQHPDRVKHLILADPWGFAEKPPNYKPPTFFRIMGVILFPFTYFNPLAAIRAVGPLGPALVRKMRGDIARRYSDSFENTDVITEYIYQCNSQYPSGETAFHSFVKGFGWSKNPMVHRFDMIHESTPITLLYGEHSWIDPSSGFILREQREDFSYVNIDVIQDAGHHLYSDQPEIFNKCVKETCRIADNNEDTKEKVRPVNFLKEQFNESRWKDFIDPSYPQKITKEEIDDIGESENDGEERRDITAH